MTDKLILIGSSRLAYITIINDLSLFEFYSLLYSNNSMYLEDDGDLIIIEEQ